MKIVNVVAAVLYQDGKIFITQRADGDFKGMWEFPGGKIEAGETHRQALEREIMEELSVSIHMEEYLMTLEHDYVDFHLKMTLYWSRIKEGTIYLTEHLAGRWLPISKLKNINWVPADVVVVDKIIEQGHP